MEVRRARWQPTNHPSYMLKSELQTSAAAAAAAERVINVRTSFRRRRFGELTLTGGRGDGCGAGGTCAEAAAAAVGFNSGPSR